MYDFTDGTEPVQFWKVLKQKVKVYVQNWEKESRRESKAHKRHLYRVLNQLKEEIDEGTEVWYEFKEVKDELRKIEEKEFEIWKLKNRLAEEENAEQVNLAMKIKAKKKRENNRIRGLRNKQGEIVENEEKIQTIAEDFYKQSYALPDQEQDSRMDSLADSELGR
jgi:hypothetical protein